MLPRPSCSLFRSPLRRLGVSLIAGSLMAVAVPVARAQSGELLAVTGSSVYGYLHYDDINTIQQQLLLSVGASNLGGSYYSSIASLSHIATDPLTGVLYATGIDTANNGAIFRFNPDGSGGTELASGGLLGSAATSTSTPRYLSFHNGSLFTSIGDGAGSAVLQITPVGGLVTPFNHAAVTNPLNRPQGLAFDSSGNLFVANGVATANNSANFTVAELDPTGNTLTNNFTGVSSFYPTSPTGLTFGPDGALYVTSTGSNGSATILRFYGSGANAGQADPGVSNGIQDGGATYTFNGILRNPQGIQFSPADGNLFIAFFPASSRFTTGSVYSYSGPSDTQNTGAGTPFSIGLPTAVNDIAFSPAPEPGGFVAILTGVAALGLRVARGRLRRN